MPEKKGKTIKRKHSSLTIKDQNVPTKVSKQTVAKVFIASRLQDRPPGKVLVMGQGDVGQLGLGEEQLEKKRPTLVPGLTDIVDISAGGMHTVCLTSEGEVITFGCNDEGALGRHTDEGDEMSPGKVKLEGKAVQITAGDSHSAALLEDGRVFAWGAFRDSHGTMGLIKEEKTQIPTFLGVNHIKKIASGSDHLLMLNRHGEVFSCGCPEQGQLGRICERGATRESRQGLSLFLAPFKVTFMRSKVEIDNIWAGSHSSFARARNGRIFVFGLNNYKQLGLEELKCFFSPVQSVLSERVWKKVCGDIHHTISLAEDGAVCALGRKEYGRLGLGQASGDGDSEDVGRPTDIPALQNKKCTDVSCGTSCSFAVSNDGLVYSWGMGSSGQLGVGDEEDFWEPTLVKGKQLEGLSVLAVSAGGQHTVLLASSSNAMDET